MTPLASTDPRSGVETIPAAPLIHESRVLEAVRRAAVDRPDQAAVTTLSCAEQKPCAVTWRGLAAAIDRAARAITSRTGPDDVVPLWLPNGHEFVIAFVGAIACGRRVLPISISAGAGECRRVARHVGARAVIASPDAAADLDGIAVIPPQDLQEHAPAAPVAPVDPPAGVLLQSSGTTGLPKLVLRAVPALNAVALAITEATRLTPADRVLACVPMSHSYGMEHCLLAPLAAGASIIAIDSIDPAPIADAIEQHRATVLPGVPFLFESLTPRAPAGPCTLRLAYSAGGPLPSLVAARFSNAWRTPVGQLYGATEIGSVTFEDPAEPGFDAARVGRPMRAVQLVISDPGSPGSLVPVPAGTEGQVLVRAESMLSGYLDADLALVEGYFPTGDLGRLDGAGRLTLTGRLKLMIDVGGAKVNPLEVESVLREHPSVGECVVVRLTVSETVSRLRAVIAVRPGGPAPSIPELRAFARARLAPYKVPRVFEVHDSLPRSATGKILRAALENRQ